MFSLIRIQPGPPLPFVHTARRRRSAVRAHPALHRRRRARPQLRHGRWKRRVAAGYIWPWPAPPFKGTSIWSWQSGHPRALRRCPRCPSQYDVRLRWGCAARWAHPAAAAGMHPHPAVAACWVGARAGVGSWPRAPQRPPPTAAQLSVGMPVEQLECQLDGQLSGQLSSQLHEPAERPAALDALRRR